MLRNPGPQTSTPNSPSTDKQLLIQSSEPSTVDTALRPSPLQVRQQHLPLNTSTCLTRPTQLSMAGVSRAPMSSRVSSSTNVMASRWITIPPQVSTWFHCLRRNAEQGAAASDLSIAHRSSCLAQPATLHAQHPACSALLSWSRAHILDSKYLACNRAKHCLQRNHQDQQLV